MAFLGTAFDPNAQEPSQDYSALPSGEYPVMVVESDVKEVKPPKVGTYLELQLQVLEGAYKGRLVWARITRENPNSQQAVDIGAREFTSLCIALGITQQITDSVVLHNRPFIARVEFVPTGTKQGKNGYVTTKDGNDVRGYKKLEGAVAGAVVAGQSAANTAAPGQPAQPAGKPAWANRGAAGAGAPAQQ